MDLTLLEANVDNTSAVGEAVQSLIGRDAQAIWVGGDNTVMAAVNPVIATATRMHVPVFTVLPGKPDRGTLFDAGPDFYQVGRLGGGLAADILDGGDMSKRPVGDVLDVSPPYLSINTTVLKSLKEPWQAPAALRADANAVVDASGIRRKAAAAPPITADARAPAKKWRLSLIELNQVTDVEEAEHGVLDGLRESGMVEGRDFDKTIRNAQGDMATVSGLVDASLGNSDLLVTFSTPTLQAALQRAKRLPIVFNQVADPISAGAGTSDSAHLPNVTGVYFIGAYDLMMPLIHEYLPKAHVLGTVYVPAEVNMVAQLAVMRKAVTAAGMELKTVAANSPTEVGDAALALASAHVDAICQLPGNLTASAFPSIARVSQQARLPVFVFQSSQVRAGAVAGVSRDYYESGREAGHVAARVMRGESPAGIPFMGFAKTKLIVNVGAARAMGLTSPAHIVGKADDVLGR